MYKKWRRKVKMWEEWSTKSPCVSSLIAYLLKWTPVTHLLPLAPPLFLFHHLLLPPLSLILFLPLKSPFFSLTFSLLGISMLSFIISLIPLNQIHSLLNQ